MEGEVGLRGFLEELEKSKKLLKFRKPVDPNLEIARVLRENDGKAVLFENVKKSRYRIVGGICGSRENFATALEVKKEELLFRISDAIKNPKEPEIVEKGSCQEIVEEEIDLSEIPILTHSSRDMGPYITAGVFIAKDTEYGLNADYHRACPIAKDKLVARVCQRDLYKYMERCNGDLEVAICIGLHPSVSLAAAISAGIHVNELAISNSLRPLHLVKCKTVDLYVPENSEIVLEGIITKERHDEGPFVDITGTHDLVRKEPVIKINCITHRKNPIYQALLPAYSEHKLLMGMPREPVIYNEVNKVCRCKNVILTNGGCSWLHGIVQIEKENSDDGKKAIEAAFNGHGSMKHVVIVDDDIDIHDPDEIEWAIATRVQADKDVVMKKEKGSSLDPSAGEDRTTCKVGIDATMPWDKDRKKFERIELGE